MLDFKEELKAVGLGLIYIIVFITAVRYFKLNVFQVYGVICAISLVTTIYKKEPFKGWVIGCIYVAILFGFLYLLGGYGIIGYFVSCFAIAGWIIYKRWNKFLEIKWHMETMIWGKPLKEIVKEGKKPSTKQVKN